MVTINIVTGICLAILIVELLVLLVSLLLRKRADRIAFLRNFKKGKCVIIYITSIPLYCIGHIYAGKDFLAAFFDAVSKIISLVVLKYDTGSISELMNANSLYRFSIYFTFTMVGINAILLSISIAYQHVWEFFQRIRAFFTRKDKVFLFGNNKDNLCIYKSDNKRYKVIIDKISTADCERMYLEKITYISTSNISDTIERLFKLIQKRARQYTIIINTGSDDKNMLICRQFVDAICSLKDENKNKLFSRLKVFVFGDSRYEAIYLDFVTRGYGCLHYVNKHQKIAIDYIDRYPLTAFMNDKLIDYETSLIREDIDINVILIGFGKTNKQIFLTSVANNQFLTGNELTPRLKPVKYHIFDKDPVKHNKNLNHDYYRYKNESTGLKQSEYLPFPDLPAEEYYYRIDINDSDFYNKINQVATHNKNDVNYIVIAFGSDLENIDLAQKLVAKRNEWNIKNLAIFVKVRECHKEQMLPEDAGCYFIGNEADSVYNLEKILGDKIFKMAQMRNETYDLEYAITHVKSRAFDENFIKKKREESIRNWYFNKSQLERESSLYCCLSLRSKLHLIGLDYCKKEFDNDSGLSEKEYLLRYAGDDVQRTLDNVTASGRPIIMYPLDFAQSKRKIMAIQEHYRWNSFMISKGIIPASKDLILNETAEKSGRNVYTNGKNYSLRRHGNLSTFDGLIEFRKMITQRDGNQEIENDVIKYDYQLMDDAYWLLKESGYKIIKKNN